MNKKEIIDILKSANLDILKKADEVRKKTLKDGIYLRALIEFSNVCNCNCLYCGLQKCNKNIKRYNMKPDEIIERAKYAIKLGYKTIVLQSGENNCYDIEIMSKIISEIKKFDVALTLSIGEKTFEEYKTYKDFGADRYLLRIETTNKKLYQKMHPNASFENRIECLKNLKKLGYEVGSGSLIGLPYQTIEDIADDILFFKEMDFDMIGLGPFIPHQDTILKNENKGSLDLTLKAIAIIRILMPNINIPATTAMETIEKDGRIKALMSGANVIMPNMTPDKYKQDYEIYPNKNYDYENLEEKLAKINRFISKDFGYRKK